MRAWLARYQSLLGAGACSACALITVFHPLLRPLQVIWPLVTGMTFVTSWHWEKAAGRYREAMDVCLAGLKSIQQLHSAAITQNGHATGWGEPR